MYWFPPPSTFTTTFILIGWSPYIQNRPSAPTHRTVQVITVLYNEYNFYKLIINYIKKLFRKITNTSIFIRHVVSEIGVSLYEIVNTSQKL